jgi:SRSO17 transposase
MPTVFSQRQLDDYLVQFRRAFPRRDQLRWANLYLQGLLRDLPRKNVQTMAQHLRLPKGLKIKDVTQALQHFLNQSPWEERDVLHCYRALVAQRFADSGGVLVVDEITFPKQGKRSVGVQRQYSASLEEKLNCQIAVAVHLVGPAGCYPLGVRLYLPGRWLQSPQLLDAAGVPQACRQRMTKWQIALEILDELRCDGIPVRCVISGQGFRASPEALEALTQQTVDWLIEVSEEVVVRLHPSDARVAATVTQPLPLRELVKEFPLAPLPAGARDVKASRLAWVPVYPEGDLLGPARAGAEPVRLLVESRGESNPVFALTNLPAETPLSEAGHRWEGRRHAAESIQLMKAELGLDHFKGRSWRGFHHHSCLVMLACGLLLAVKAQGCP